MTLDPPNYTTSYLGATNRNYVWQQCWWKIRGSAPFCLVHHKNGSYYVSKDSTDNVVSEIYDNFNEACMTFLMMSS
jgi:hypothetical protein